LVHLVAEARHTAGTTNLETEMYDSAEARKYQRPQGQKFSGRAGAKRDVTISQAYVTVKPTGKAETTHRMQEPATRKRSCRSQTRKGLDLKPGIILKILPREENCRLKPVPEKTKPNSFEQHRALLYGFANL
jgi:hypothetical protein